MEPPDLKSIFGEALDREPGPQRSAYLDEACRGDAALRAQVEELLSDHDRAGRFLESAADPATARPTRAQIGDAPPDTEVATVAGNGPRPGPGATRTHANSADSTADHPPRWLAERAGDRIGPFKLLQEIGQGGMGTVYMAEQERPVRRRVALKVIKAGMDTGQVVARFEAERQALAMMDHPNIARVLDAGATDTGRPYFVMELVKGIPITRYCDEARLSPAERLELFIPVCQAIQHAHQKGVVHRDVKPSNVLVTLIDGRPVPKVIDFGVAKATDQRLTERTMFTQFGALVGTPEYMSPEQAEISGMDVDTRSDVYSLGVLLYELLTGTTPLDRETLRTAAFAEVLRRIKEEEPPKPSTRLSASGDRLASLSAVRRTDPQRLSRTMRGDLDWIVMRALEKDRTRRYETAAGFAQDVRRYLDGDPVEAGPPSASYRLRKLARKHRAALVTTGAFALLLVAATVVSAVLAFVATRAKQAALAAESRARADRDRAMIAEAKMAGALGETRKAKAATDAALSDTKRAKEQAEAVAAYFIAAFRKPDPALDGREVKVVDVLDQAVANLEAEFAGPPAVKAAVLHALGETYLDLGLSARAVEVLTKAVTAAEATLGADHVETLRYRNRLGMGYAEVGRLDEAIALHTAILEAMEARLGADAPETLASRNNLSTAYWAAGRLNEAIALQEATLKASEKRFGPDDNNTIRSRTNLAVAYQDADRLREAIPMLEAALKSGEAKLGWDHPTTLLARNNLSVAYLAAGRLEEATALAQATVQASEKRLGPDHHETLTYRTNLADTYRAAGRLNEAIALQEATLKTAEAKHGPNHGVTLASRVLLARAYRTAGRPREAIPLYESALRVQERKPGPAHPDTLMTRKELAGSYMGVGRLDEAIALLEATLKTSEAVRGPVHRETLRLRASLAIAYHHAGRLDEAIALEEATLKAKEAHMELNHPSIHATRGNLAMSYADAGRLKEAIAILEANLRISEARQGPDHPHTLNNRENLATVYQRDGQLARADALSRENLDLARKRYGSDDVLTLQVMSWRGITLLAQKKWIEAEPVLRECLAIREKSIPDDWRRFNTMSLLGQALLGQERYAEAEPLIVGGFEGVKAREASVPGISRKFVAEAADRVVRLYEAWGQPEKAAEWRVKLLGPTDPPPAASAAGDLPANPFAR